MKEINKAYWKAIVLVCGVLAVGITNFSRAANADSRTKNRPNILLILTDQQTVSAASCYGNKYLSTPAIDKLADSGIRFTRNYVTQPLCLPFRSSLQTGQYPHEINAINNGGKIPEDTPMLGNLVASSGYKTHYIGKRHVGMPAGDAGYAFYDNVGIDEKKSEAAVAFLSAEQEQPFFLTVSFMNPHNVCQLARADALGTDLPDGGIGIAPSDTSLLPPLPANFAIPDDEPGIIREIQEKSLVHYPTANWDELIWRQYLWGYYRLVEKVDSEILKVLNALEKSGKAENTVIIFTSDHGEGVAMHHWNQKQILYDQAVTSPFIISWKGKTSKKVYPQLVSNALDIPLTILDLAGAEIPNVMRGKSLMRTLHGLPPEKRDYVVSETMFARGSQNLGATGRMLRTEKYKYCIYDKGEKREQLFHMELDAGEQKNLAYNAAFKSVLEHHRKKMLEWAELTNDKAFPYYK